MGIERALPHPEHITCIASKHLTDKASAIASFANDLFNRHTILGEGQNRRIWSVRLAGNLHIAVVQRRSEVLG